MQRDDVIITVLPRTDLPQITELYNHYILNTTSTYDWDPFTETEMDERLFRFGEPYLPYAIYSDGRLRGFCKLSPFNPKKGYKITAEVSLYLHPEHTGSGIGKTGLTHLEELAKQNGIKNLIPIICSENRQSIAFFQKYGYTENGRLKKVGYKFNRYLDTLYFQKRLKE